MNYWECFFLLSISRAADLISTRIVSPTLALESNRWMKRLGWKGAILLNLALCLVFATKESSTVILSVASLLVAVSNTDHAWLIRGMGELRYRKWAAHVISKASIGSYAFSILANAGFAVSLGFLIGYVGDFSPRSRAAAMGVFAYVIAVTFHRLFRP